MTEDQARETECCVMDKTCTASKCMGWRWTLWRSGMNAPANATHAGPSQRLVIDGAYQGYCGRAGPDEFS